jgi:hypothetical protein
MRCFLVQLWLSIELWACYNRLNDVAFLNLCFFFFPYSSVICISLQTELLIFHLIVIK